MSPRLALAAAWLAGSLAAGCSIDRAALQPQPAPPAPSDLEAAVVRYDAVALRWVAPAGPSGVRSFRVFRDGAPVGECAEPLFVDRGAPLTSRHAIRYEVRAVGPSGIESLPSEPVVTPTAFPRAAVPEPILGGRSELRFVMRNVGRHGLSLIAST